MSSLCNSSATVYLYIGQTDRKLIQVKAGNFTSFFYFSLFFCFFFHFITNYGNCFFMAKILREALGGFMGSTVPPLVPLLDPSLYIWQHFDEHKNSVPQEQQSCMNMGKKEGK